MKVSVSIVTFQQEGFIEQAVQSALAQETDFPFEVIVGDDASSDGTVDVLKRLQSQHPDKLRLLLAEKNYGDRGLSNVMATMDAAQGEYIAFLDGDDFWTAPNKLQRQIDFLEAHPECAICVHRTQHLLAEDETLLSPRPARGDAVLPVGKLLTNNFAEKISTVVRSSAVAQVPEWYRTTDAISADWVFNILAASTSGFVGYIDSVMAVHRLHADSMSIHFGADRLLTDKLKSIEAVRPYLPEEAQSSVWRAQLLVRLKRMILKVSPHAYLKAKKLKNKTSSP